jgi:hypothetical protein
MKLERLVHCGVSSFEHLDSLVIAAALAYNESLAADGTEAFFGWTGV